MIILLITRTCFTGVIGFTIARDAHARITTDYTNIIFTNGV